MNAGVQLDAYLRMCDTLQERLRATKPTDSLPRQVLKNAVPRRFRGTARMLLTDMVAPRERKKATQLMTTRPFRLHLGCGGVHKDGWVNVDFVGDPIDLAWNLSKPLPFPDASVDAIFHEHLLEHLPLRDGLRFTRECFRVLRPGGVIRVGVPDAGRLLRSYLDPADGYLDQLHPGRPTRLLAAQELFYWHRHCTMYDADTLNMLLEGSGLADIHECSFGESNLQPAPDTERRRVNTLYVEAARPA